MKKAIAIIFFSMIATVVTYAQRTPHINHREARQHVRIHQGVRSGELTHNEAVRLRTEQRHIRRTEHKAKADGVVTGEERARIEHKQNRAGRDIRRQKHDEQDRN
jgi:uncharacterized membrane protein YebE (DUF533 family)